MGDKIRVKREDLPKKRNLVVRDMILAGKSQQTIPDRRKKRSKDKGRSWRQEEW